MTDTTEDTATGIALDGLDACNPLAFLAALGTLRLATLGLPTHSVRMAWKIGRGAWRPSLFLDPAIECDEFICHLDVACRYGVVPSRRDIGEQREAAYRAAVTKHDQTKTTTESSLKKQGLTGKKLAEQRKTALAPLEASVASAERAWFEAIAPHLLIGDDLTVAGDTFASFSANAARLANLADRSVADFAAAFGCGSIVGEDGRIADTALRTMAGAGHQHFLGFMRNIVAATTAEHLRKSLFESWRYDDPVRNMTLRWDPADDSRYALQWRDPSKDSSRTDSGSMLGANRLAIEGLPLLPTIPQSSWLATTGFRGRKSSDTFWTWPVWSVPLRQDTVRSLLLHAELHSDEPSHGLLNSLGVADIFRSQRLTIGKVRNFTPGQSV